MRKIFLPILIIALVLSWLWFWTVLDDRSSRPMSEGASRPSDTVTVWVDELLGTPDESYYYQLADLWNRIEPDIHMKMSVMGHAGYDSKLRVAIASGQPPDVCSGGVQTLESLQYSGKASDLAVPIPETYFPKSEFDEMGPIVQQSVVRDGRPVIFPIWRYSYGGIILANNDMLKQAGFDDEAIRKHGWTIDEFRRAAKSMTRDTDGDGKIDTWGFGAALVHLQELFMNDFGPGIWGRELTKDNWIAYDAAAKRWKIDPRLTENQIEQVFSLFNDLMNVDKSWNPGTLGMNFNEILDDVTVHRTLGMTFGETPWVPFLRQEIWQDNQAMGAHLPPLPPLTAIWMPTARAGEFPVPHAGVLGFSVLKQVPYKGDVHTDHAMRVGLFLTHPVNLARSQIRRFRHLPPDPIAFGKIYPELMHSDNKWVQFYNHVMDSGIPVVTEQPSSKDPTMAQAAELSTKIGRWIQAQGMEYLQEVIYQKLTPHEGAEKFFHDLQALDTNTGQ